jgi:hypothetical protein
MLSRTVIAIMSIILALPHLASAAGSAGGGPRTILPEINSAVYISGAEWLRMENRIRAFGQATINLPDQELLVEEVAGQIQTIEEEPRLVLRYGQ